MPKTLTSGGLPLGHHLYKGQKQAVYIPTTDIDDLMLPRVVIGGQGSGKTQGYGANLAVEAARAGMCAVIIDPAKGEMGNRIEAAYDNVIRYRFGDRPVALDWREVRHSPKARNRFAAELTDFVEAATDEAGAQTVRFLRAAAKAVPSTRLSEIVRVLADARYRESLMTRMQPRDRVTWEDFSQLSAARQSQIIQPVLNRLDVVLGDDYLAECLEAHGGIDLVDMLNKPGTIVVFDLPKKSLGKEALDVLGSWLTTKLNLAMLLRTTEHPVFVIQDEPHSYLRSVRTWKEIAVESRKYRFAYAWLFHAWEQIPHDLAAIIRAAGPHYHLYSSSYATYDGLKHEIKPWTPEECLQIKKHHALNIIRIGGRMSEPFLAQMLPPPSKVLLGR